MPAPAVAVLAWRQRHRLLRYWPWLLGLLAAAVMLVVGTVATIVGVQPVGVGLAGYAPSPFALRDIPPLYLQTYQAAGQLYGVDPWILAAIGKIETDHGRSTAPGVRSGVNSYGCCAGPMQFSIRPRPSTWDAYGRGGDVYDLRDAIPAAARYLVAGGAPSDYRRAIFAYNHADWYVADVMALAERYRGESSVGPVAGADVQAILRDPRITLTAVQRTDLLAGGFDERLLAIMAWLGKTHTYVVTALRADHAPGTNHEAGRAVDIGAVDGHLCINATPSDPCGRVLIELARLRGELRPTELIGCFDADPADPDVWAQADHCDHDHVGFDA